MPGVVACRLCFAKAFSANINYNIGGGAAGWQAFADYWPAKGCPKE